MSGGNETTKQGHEIKMFHYVIASVDNADRLIDEALAEIDPITLQLAAHWKRPLAAELQAYLVENQPGIWGARCVAHRIARKAFGDLAESPGKVLQAMAREPDWP